MKTPHARTLGWTLAALLAGGCDKTTPESSGAGGSVEPAAPKNEGADASTPGPETTKPQPETTKPPPETTKPPEPSDLRVKLDYLDGERSKDSSERRVKATIEDLAVTYYGPFAPCERGRCRHQEVTFELTGAQRSELAEVLDQGGLLATFEEKADAGGIGSYVVIHLETRWEGESGAIDIVGMASREAAPGERLGEEAHEWKGRVNRLRTHLRELVETKHPGAR